VTPIPKQESKLQFVDYSVEYPDENERGSLSLPVVDLKMRNTCEEVAFVKEVEFRVLNSATFEDCRQPQYELVKESASYDIDIEEGSKKAISHAIKPADVDRIKFRIGRKKGGPTLTVYKTVLRITYDEDNKVQESKPFFLKMVGPMVPLAMTTMGTPKAEWDACVQRNISTFKQIGFKIYKDEPDCDQCSGP
jgi:hypothetical protein